MSTKALIIYIIGCLILLWIILEWGSYLIVHNLICKREGLTNFERYVERLYPFPKDAQIHYDDLNSPLYSHTVDLPLTNKLSCQNFCGPQAQCAITRTQCTSDVDCYGCNPGPTPLTASDTMDVAPYDDGGKLGPQGVQYSPLTTGVGYDSHSIDFAEASPGSKNAQIKKPYLGVDLWQKSFNDGLQLYNKKRESYDKYSEGISQAIIDTPNSKPFEIENKYPTTISTTGTFYETLPPASNAYLS